MKIIPVVPEKPKPGVIEEPKPDYVLWIIIIFLQILIVAYLYYYFKNRKTVSSVTNRNYQKNQANFSLSEPVPAGKISQPSIEIQDKK